MKLTKFIPSVYASAVLLRLDKAAFPYTAPEDTLLGVF